MNTANGGNGRNLLTLDGWRALAILMVVGSHSLAIESARNGAGGMVNLLTFRLGTFGVMLFFAISGFLISTRLLSEAETQGAVSLRSFYVRRIFRILPTAYGYLAVIAVLATAGIVTVTRLDFAAAALFFSNYVSPDSWFTGHFWSLAIEEHFYLFWPPILVKFGRKGAVAAGLILILLTAFLRWRTALHSAPGADLPGYTQLRLDAFMFPCILAILLRAGPNARRFRQAMTLPVWCGTILALGVAIALGALLPAFREPQRLVQSALLPVIVATTVVRPEDLPAGCSGIRGWNGWAESPTACICGSN